MRDDIILLDGSLIYSEFISDLSQVMEHVYDIDEVFALYGEWVRQGERFVDEFAMGLYEANPSDPCDDYIAMRNAMINLYCRLDTTLSGLDRRKVRHAAYSGKHETVAVSIGR